MQCIHILDDLASDCKAQGSIPSTAKKEKEKKLFYFELQNC